MKNNILIRALLMGALLIVAVPAIASAQIYNRYDYDRSDRRDVRDAIARLDNASARLQGDLNRGNERRVLGGLLSFRSVDNEAVDQVRDFRRAVRDLRASSRGGFALDRSVDEARRGAFVGGRHHRDIGLSGLARSTLARRQPRATRPGSLRSG